MLATANSALDLGVLQRRCLLLLDGVLLLLLVRLPVGARSEDDVLTDAGGICLWSAGFALLLAKFLPCLALGDPWVYDCAEDVLAYSACAFDFLALVVEAVGYDVLAAVLVLGDLWLRQIDGIVLFFRPVCASAKC